MEIGNKYFPFLLAISSIVVEACAVFFSVYGLTKLFSGAVVAVAVMATSLEIAKVVSTTYLYRQWNKISILFKVYFVTAVFILMTITSLGIYGFLNNAFQSSTLGIEKESTQLEIYENEITTLKEQNQSTKQDKASIQKALTDELNGLVMKEDTRYTDANKRKQTVNRYQPLITEKDNLISANNKKISALTDSVSVLKVRMIDTGMDVGPIIFVSKALGVAVSTTVQYLIILFIIVFDPLALALMVAFNQMILVKFVEPTKSNISLWNTPEEYLTVDTNQSGSITSLKNDAPVVTTPIPEENKVISARPINTSSF